MRPVIPTNEDAVLASKCVEGDETAQKLLYERYAACVYLLCVRYVGEKELAKDLMQDCFIRVFENIRKYDYSKASLKTWISHLTVNFVIDYLRRHRELSFISIDDYSSDISEPEENDLVKVPREVILSMIANLPDTKRVIFNLYCIENYTHKEIAALLKIKENTSTSILYKARVQLMEMIHIFIKENEL